MPSIVPGFEYDIFISYRHNDNRSGWVTDFVNAVQEELSSTIKDSLTIYFDKNPHDGLLETHNVDKSLEGKLKCLIFIPIISQTYCDPKSFAWQHEFCAFNKLAKEDQFDRDIKLSNGNITSRILPIKIHDVDDVDKSTIESEIGGALRAIDFIFKSPGVNRPLRASEEHPQDNLNKTFYRDQINKVANAVKELITAIKNPLIDTRKTDNHQLTTKSLSKRKYVLIALIFLLLVTAAYFSYPKFNSQSEEVIDKSIAVLPFVNMSNDPQQEYFSDGITEEILNTLVKIKDLKVAGRTSSFQYKGRNLDLKTIGKELGVAFIMEGSIRKTNDEVRITAQVINASNGFHLWSEEYTGSLSDVFKLQEQVSIDIARTLSDKLGVSGLSNLKNKHVKVEAFDYYLKGRQFFMKRERHKEMRQLFRMAIQADSTFDQAYSSLAESLALIDLSRDSIETARYRAESSQLASKALRLDSFNVEAYSVLGILSDYKQEWVNGRKYLEKAVQLNPGNSTANLWFGQHLSRMGHFAQAQHYIEKATSLEPFYAINYQWLANIATYTGDIESAVEHAKKATAVGDDGWGAGILMGAFLEANQPEKLKGLKTKDAFITAWMQAIIERDTLKLQNLMGKPRDMAAFEYCWIGNREGAMRTILKYGEVWETFGRYRGALRRMPGFKKAIVKFGFVDYWKKYGGPDICPDIIKNNLKCD